MDIELINHKEQSILLDTSDIITCPVNTVGVMGAGLALEFANTYPALYYYYKKLCRNKKFTKDNLILYQIPDKDQLILLAPTKEHWKESSSIELITNTLKNIIDKLPPSKSLALPALGCGLGGLNQDEVLPLMFDTLKVYQYNYHKGITIYT